MSIVSAPVKSSARVIKLSQLQPGESARIVRVAVSDHGCRKRFAELGIAEGARVTVTSCGECVMVQLGCTRMGLACRCAEDITVMKLAS